MSIKVGVCGFTRKYYEILRVVELQRTFYNIPMEKTVKRWRGEAPESFEFTFKVFQGLTHPANSPTWRRYRGELDSNVRNLVGSLQLNDYTRDIMQKMVLIAKILRSPVIVVQTPSRFNYSQENLERAINFFTYLSELLTRENINSFIGWEPRGDWLKNYEALREILSKVPKLIHVTDPFFHKPASLRGIIYFRLHGKPYLNYKYVYRRDDYEELYRVIEEIKSSGNIETIYVMFNNIKMLDNAREFEKFIEDRGE